MTGSAKQLRERLEEIFGFDLRSLGLFRVCLALVVLADLFARFQNVVAHYSDAGALPLSSLPKVLASPFYWSIFALNGSAIVQSLLFLVAIAIAFLLLVGYRTRLATIATWAMIVSLHHRNPLLLFAADDVIRAILFWSMFLPLGATYSVDSALNTNPNPLPKRILSGATIAFMVQICFIYMWSAAFKTKSETWWPDGTAVYYALSYDRYATAFAGFLLALPLPLQKIFTFSALGFEWVGPLLIFIPFRNSFFKIVAIVSFILLHVGFGLSFHLGIFPFLSISHWLPLIPSVVWDRLDRRIQTPEREGLRINYDRDCGFCKKVVYFLRTFLILPRTPILVAQDNPSVYEDMERYNSWVVEDWQGKRYFKWEGIAYIVSLSPILWWLAPILRVPPLMAIGTRVYEWIASHRRFMGNFTRWFTFRPLVVRSYPPLNILAIALLLFTTVWNVRGFVRQSVERGDLATPEIQAIDRFFRRRTFNILDSFARITRLDQYWSIFAPAPPRDDGWYVAVSRLADGSEVDLFRQGQPISWDKPTDTDRNRQYKTMQWRQYFINLDRAIGRSVYSEFSAYLCRDWNSRHDDSRRVKSLDIYILRERTVPPGEVQTVEKQLLWKQDCSNGGGL
jgi:predicted DCC family thiol-disulfide oxidoreductase YuxK